MPNENPAHPFNFSEYGTTRAALVLMTTLHLKGVGDWTGLTLLRDDVAMAAAWVIAQEGDQGADLLFKSAWYAASAAGDRGRFPEALEFAVALLREEAGADRTGAEVAAAVDRAARGAFERWELRS